jgi:AraC-like DNA-binding protein
MQSLNFASFLPSAPLAPYVECYWTLTGSKMLLAEQFMPADSRVEIHFSFDGGMRRTLATGEEDCVVTSSSYVLGARARGYRFSALDAPRYLAVRFKPGGLYAFTRLPISGLLDIHAPLDCFWEPGEVRDLEEQLAAIPTPHSQVLLVEAALLKHLDPPEHLRRILLAAAFIRANERLRLPIIADHINISQKHMERLFQRYVGMRPNLFSRIERFHRVMARGIRAVDMPSLSALATDEGYFDQAHFSREFKHFTGSTPSVFLAAQHTFVNTTLSA